MSRKFTDGLQAPPERQAVSFTLAAATAEKLVGLGFRCWLAGYRTGDISCWELAWDAYCHALGPHKAKTAVSDLSCWVRSIREASQRDIMVYPAFCRGFCQDEWMAIQMVAAGQHGACPVMRACAVTLLANGAVDEVLGGAVSFGESLKTAGQILPWNRGAGEDIAGGRLPASAYLAPVAPVARDGDSGQ